MKGQFFAVASGALAAAGGLCGKYAMAKSEAHWLCHQFVIHYVPSHMDINNEAKFVNTLCNNVNIYIRIAFGILMLLINSVMLTMFVKALRLCKSSLEATVTNTAANFFFSAIFGKILFDETLTILWWVGTVLIMFGLLLMNQPTVIEDSKSKSNRFISHPKRE